MKLVAVSAVFVFDVAGRETSSATHMALDVFVACDVADCIQARGLDLHSLSFRVSVRDLSLNGCFNSQRICWQICWQSEMV